MKLPTYLYVFVNVVKMNIFFKIFMFIFSLRFITNDDKSSSCVILTDNIEMVYIGKFENVLEIQVLVAVYYNQILDY